MNKAAMCVCSVLVSLPPVAFGDLAFAQDGSPTSITQQAIISEPPGPLQDPAEAIGRLRPGEVILHSAPVRVRFQTPTRGVSFWLKTGAMHSETKGWWLDLGIIISKQGSAFDPGFGVHSSDTHTREYVPICEEQCEATVPAGSHRFALSLDGGKPLEPKYPTVLMVDSIVEGRYRNRKPLRIVGWCLWGIGSVTGTMMMLLSTSDTEEPYTLDIRNKAAFYAGAALTVVAFGVGIPLAVQKDKAIINVYPLDK